MKSIKVSIISILSVFIFNVSYAKTIAVVSILPVKFFVDSIAKDLVDTSVSIPPGANPTIFEPRPKQIVKIKQASVYFSIGVPFEKKWIDRIEKINPKIDIIELYKSVKRVPMSNRYKYVFGKKVGVSKDFLDPHIWLSPSLARVMAQEIRDFFIYRDRKNRGFYLTNYLKLIRQIDEVDLYLIDIFSKIKKRCFVVFHPSWGYFARDYGLIQIPIEVEGKEPSPRQISKLISLAREKHIKVLFVQPQFSKKIARIIGAKINADIVEIDPLSYNWVDNLKEVGKKLFYSFKKSE